MPNSALTRWLKQGLTRGECPLCRAAHRSEHEYLWYFFDEYSGEERALEELRAAHGFCARHARGLRTIEVDNLRSTLGLTQTYEDLLAGVAGQLRGLRPGRAVAVSPCPACAHRDAEVERQAGYLVELLGEDARTRERYERSPGLCLPHFRLAWPRASGEVADLLLGVERRSLEGLRDELTEHVRKQGAEARAEPAGPEADAWQRAIHLTAGWPDRDLDGD